MARITPSLQPSERDSTRTLITLGAVIAALYFGREILVPIALAILLSFALAPMVRQLHKLGLGHVTPVAITVVFAFVIIASLGGLIATQLRQLTADLPRYEATVVQKIELVKGMSSGGGLQKIEDAFSRFRSAISRAAPAPAGAQQNEGAPNANAGGNPGASPAPLPVQIIQPPLGPVDTIMIVASPLLHPLATTGIVLIFVVFILLQRTDLRNRAIRLFGATDLQRTTAAIDDGAKRLSRYLLAQCALNAVAGFLVGLALWLIGVPNPILLGILFACLRFIPYVGPVLGAVLPVGLAIAVDPGWSMAVWTIATILVIEAVIGQVVEPFAYGHNTGLSPIAIVAAATFWTVLWGPVGLFLATPLTVCLVVLGRHVDSLAFLDVLLGDQPALTPPELFYQRMLARDPIEASDLARRYLSDMSVADYYDNVVLPALLMAQSDVDQDRLDLDHQRAIKQTALEVIEDLDDDDAGEGQKVQRRFWRLGRRSDGDEPKTKGGTDDLAQQSAPENLRAKGSVLCLGARGPLDDVAAAMLAQIFESHDIGATVESHTSLTRSGVDALDVGGVAILCLSALDASSAAYLRFILRRLRRKAPHAQILLGTWWRREGRRDSDAEIDEAIRDPKVATFVDALHYCLTKTPGPDAAKADSPPSDAEPGLRAVS